MDIDTSKGHKSLDEIEQRAKQIYAKQKEIIETIDKESKASFNEVLGIARAGWTATQLVAKASGLTISTQFAALIQMGISGIAVLQPLLTAKAMATQDWISFAIGVANLVQTGIAISAAAAGKEEMEKEMRESMLALNSIGTLLGSMSFLW